MKKNILVVLGIFVVSIIGGIFGNQILWPYLVSGPLMRQYGLEQNPVYVTETKQITVQENTALKNAIEKVDKAIIGVTSETSENVLKGSGLI